MTPPLHAPQHSRIINPQQYQGEECMSGSVHWRHPKEGPPYCRVKFRFEGKQYSFSRYRGQRMYDESTAYKLLHQIQGEVEQGTFNPLKYSKGETNVITFLYEWLEECAPNWSPGTRRLYKSMVINHIEPFFQERPYQINEVRKKQYQELRSHLGKKVLAGQIQAEFVKKVVDCLRAAMYYAFDCEIVGSPPPRIPKSVYQISTKPIRATTREGQASIIEEIPPEHRPIYQFLSMHAKFRPASAMVLKWEDYDPETDSFLIRRGISGGEEVEYNKTKQALVQAVHPDFKPILGQIAEHRAYPWSPYVFTCKESRHKHRRYTKEIFNSRWNAAAKAVGIDIDAYHGTRHTTITHYANTRTPEQTRLLAGHTTVATTLQYYGKVHIETERALMSDNVVPLQEKRGTLGERRADKKDK